MMKKLALGAVLAVSLIGHTALADYVEPTTESGSVAFDAAPVPGVIFQQVTYTHTFDANWHGTGGVLSGLSFDYEIDFNGAAGGMVQFATINGPVFLTSQPFSSASEPITGTVDIDALSVPLNLNGSGQPVLGMTFSLLSVVDDFVTGDETVDITITYDVYHAGNPTSQVPLPAAAAMFPLGLAGVAWMRRRMAA